MSEGGIRDWLSAHPRLLTVTLSAGAYLFAGGSVVIQAIAEGYRGP